MDEIASLPHLWLKLLLPWGDCGPVKAVTSIASFTCSVCDLETPEKGRLAGDGCH